MQEPLDANRLIYGGSLYPPPVIVPARHRFAVLLVLASFCLAIWVIVVLMIWPVLL